MAQVKERKQKGLGADKAARKFENTSAEDRAKANSDGRFGYFDEQNKRYVPAIVDMIDGGNRDTSGGEFAGGPLSNILNSLGISPYGSTRERQFGGPMTPLQAAVSGAGGGVGPQRSVPTVTESVRPMLRPDNFGQTVQAQREAGMGLGPFGDAGPQVVDPRGFQRGTEPMTLTAAQRAAAMNNPLMPIQDFATGAGQGPIDDGAEGAIMPSIPLVPEMTYQNMRPIAIDDGEEGAIMAPLPLITTDGQREAQRMAKAKADYRANMSRFSKANWDRMDRKTRRDAGLPETPFQMMVAGVDAFSSADSPNTLGLNDPKMSYMDYRDFVLRDPMMAGMSEDDLQAAYRFYTGSN